MATATIEAGCSCGCSPGFVVADSRGKDVWVTLTANAPKTSGKPEEEAEAAHRTAALVGDPTMPWNAEPAAEFDPIAMGM
jgi:hypothetical protein